MIGRLYGQPNLAAISLSVLTPSGMLQRKCACGGPPGPTGECAECRRKRQLGGMLQAKLRINQPGDKYEQEADRVAGQVMRMSQPDLQRQAGPKEDEEDELLQAKPRLQRDPAVGATPASAPPIVHEVLASPGRPLDAAIRATMESRFGHDFSQVRVHADERAAQSAQAVNARAYTVGRDVVFGRGEYAPGSSQGQRLLAHELTHVVQQRRGRSLARRSSLPGSCMKAPATHPSLSATPPVLQRLTDPLSDMSTFQSPGASGWRGAMWGCYRSSCTRKHKGWDVHASTGTACRAVVAGTTPHASQGSAGYGDYVVLTSSADATKKYIYAHLSTRESAGTVSEGDKIGETGVSGNASSSRPHLHFTVREGGSKVDPDGKGFTKPTKVIEGSGSTATTYNDSDPEPCTPCSM